MCGRHHQGAKHSIEMVLWLMNNLIKAGETVGPLSWVYFLFGIQVEERGAREDGVVAKVGGYITWLFLVVA